MPTVRRHKTARIRLGSHVASFHSSTSSTDTVQPTDARVAPSVDGEIQAFTPTTRDFIASFRIRLSKRINGLLASSCSWRRPTLRPLFRTSHPTAVAASESVAGVVIRRNAAAPSTRPVRPFPSHGCGHVAPPCAEFASRLMQQFWLRQLKGRELIVMCPRSYWTA